MKKTLILSVLIFLFASCTSSKGLVSEFWGLLPMEINSIGTFFTAFICIFCIQVLLSLISRIFIQLDNIIAIVLFIVVLSIKDYGFWMTLLLFLFERLLLFGLTSLYGLIRRNDN
jgi:hypothetical protein